MIYCIWFVCLLFDAWNTLCFHLPSISWFIMLSVCRGALAAVGMLDGNVVRTPRR
jgi:hypothetical protein